MDTEQEEIDNQQTPKASKSTSVSGSSDGLPVRSNSSPATADVERRVMDHDSLVTVRLSEPPSLHINTSIPPNLLPTRKTIYGPDYTPSHTMAEAVEEEEDSSSADSTPSTPVSDRGQSLQEELQESDSDSDQEQGSEAEAEEDADKSELSIERSSTGSEAVDWDQLQKKEDMESKENDSDNSTAVLLAKLEQENARIATNPKSVKVKVVEKQESPARRPRPPSMAQLRKLVSGPAPPALRYSVLPPPPMTELEFYMALVKDPQQTAARLPTLLSNKIRKGIPPPLRGVVWQSMSGARDTALEEIFERLSGESSPYEGIITKDLGRSFPGVDMFRDPEGDGQRMLGRVLKCFSLYDTKIGYCQGLAFLVGPLLMHMRDKQAFCVLVRLMENYDLRHCFVPDLSGLHVRIYQFRELLRQHLPILSAHLDDLQVEPAYVSQWFLSFFAVTCPLPMLFRIYDVIFAEGASETIMRVALSLMRKNQARILGCTELEDVMQLLLSRGLWDCYHYNADEFVHDFVNLSDVVTRERMAALEQGYREAKLGSGANTRSTDAGQASSDVTTAASRFLGRLWATSSTPKLASFAQAATSTVSNASNNLSPGLSAPSRPLSMLRRSLSKQSLASTLNSMEAVSSAPSSSAASVLSSASTEATSISRDSSADDSSRESSSASNNSKAATTSFFAGGNSAKDDTKYLNSQIEDLLTALSELQRNNALLASQLQKEREEREEDRTAVRSLLDGLRKKASSETVATSHSGDSDETITGRDASIEASPKGSGTDGERSLPSAEQLTSLLDVVEARFDKVASSRRSSMPQTKSQLRDELARAKEQLSNEVAKTQDCNRRIYEMEQEVATTKEQLRESHAHVRNLHTEKQRLEKQIHTLRVRASDTPTSGVDNADWFSRATGIGVVTGVPAPGGGLRELKLGRSKSTPTQVPTSFSNNNSGSSNNRASSIMTHKNGSRESLALASQSTSNAPISDHDALLLDLVHAKTAEAIAKQEAEEAKQKLENLRKAFGLAPGDTPPVAAHNSTVATTAASGASAAASAAIGMFGRLTGSTAQPPTAAEATTKPAVPTPIPAPAGPPAGNNGGGGFWGWRR
ncbi:rab-GTPase-TBC domain-containing protein [Lasiosphaeris hirsuta]|uniref:Rab-GTPase-TBC domain-containing protein n=1 Tax=Lasiosphaeris hirsuta TaxID=260670 RepID=A0AA40AFG7_9PEZI|nr:rab-GTPase-TBC domain-containing protein [Lasiosphaeris hirsuta]